MRLVFATSVFFSLALSISSAQALPTISGSVTDENQTPISGVKLTLSANSEHLRRQDARSIDHSFAKQTLESTVSDQNGAFTFAVIPLGAYNMCSSGAPAPFLNICKFGAPEPLEITDSYSGAMHVVLSRGTAVTIELNSLAGRLGQEQCKIVLTTDIGTWTEPSRCQASSSLVYAVFTVPVGATGHVIFGSNMKLRDGAGVSVIAEVPSYIWSSSRSAMLFSAE